MGFWGVPKRPNGVQRGVSLKDSIEIGHCGVPKGQHGDGVLRGPQKAKWCAGEWSSHGSVGLRHKGVPRGTDREQGVLKGPDEAQKGPQVLGWVLSGNGVSMERSIPDIKGAKQCAKWPGLP